MNTKLITPVDIYGTILYGIFSLDTDAWLANVRAANAGEAIRRYHALPAVDRTKPVYTVHVEAVLG